MRSFVRRLGRHPLTVSATLVLVFVFWTLPQWLATLWPVLVRERTIPEWLAERTWPFVDASLYGWLTGAAGLVILVCIAGLLLVVLSAKEDDVPVWITAVKVTQFEIDQKIAVHLTYRNEAPKLTVSLLYFLAVADEPPEGRSPDWIAAYEQVWKQTVEAPHGIKPVELKVPRGDHLFPLFGPTLTATQYQGLKSGRGALYIVGRLNYWSADGSGAVEFCRVSPDGASMALCPGRNGPVG